MTPLPALLLGGLLLLPIAAAGESYPSKPIRWIVPQATGSTADILARVTAERLAKALGQPVLVDNRPGAGGNIASELVAKSAPDGYTLGMATIATHAINPALFRSLPFDPERDFTPITLLVTAPCVLVVHPSSPARDVRQLVEWARTREHVTFGSGGNGNSQHLAGELFAAMTGIPLTHVPYKGAAQAALAVASGEVDLMFPNLPVAQPLADGGRVRMLAVTSPVRVASAPNIPAVAETLPGFAVIPWFSVVAPPGLAAPLVDKLHGQFVKAIDSPDAAAVLTKQGFEINTSSPRELGRFIAEERRKWEPIVKRSGASVD